MKINTPLFKIEIDFLVILTIIISIFSLNARNYLSNFFICYIFILFHEMSHMFFGSIFGEEIDTLKITISGVNVSFKNDISLLRISKIRKLSIYFAGPISNFLMAFLFKDIEIVYEINIFLGFLNLIPIYPLDGYNILFTILDKCKNKKMVLNFIRKFIFLGLIFLSIIQIMLYKMFSFIVFIMYLVFVSKKSKNRGV